MTPTDGGAKNVTCQVASVTPGKDGQIDSYSRRDKKGGRVRMTCVARMKNGRGRRGDSGVGGRKLDQHKREVSRAS